MTDELDPSTVNDLLVDGMLALTRQNRTLRSLVADMACGIPYEHLGTDNQIMLNEVLIELRERGHF